jgi:hypothetical protein
MTPEHSAERTTVIGKWHDKVYEVSQGKEWNNYNLQWMPAVPLSLLESDLQRRARGRIAPARRVIATRGVGV